MRTAASKDFRAACRDTGHKIAMAQIRIHHEYWLADAERGCRQASEPQSAVGRTRRLMAELRAVEYHPAHVAKWDCVKWETFHLRQPAVLVERPAPVRRSIRCNREFPDIEASTT